MTRALPAVGAAGAEVRVLHGIPGTPVDVFLNGERALDDFAPGTTSDPLGLAAGTYSVAVLPADAADASGTPVIGPVDLRCPRPATSALSPTSAPNGTPTITPFVNDTSPAAAGSGRVVVRHTAAAPAVDVLVGGSPAPTNLTDPDEDSAEVPAGTISAAVAATGTTEPVIGPADVPVVAGQATVAYAIGSLEDSTLDLLVQTVDLEGDGAPAGVPAGTGGLVDRGGLPTSVLLATGLGAAVAVGGGTALARTRRAARQEQTRSAEG